MKGDVNMNLVIQKHYTPYKRHSNTTRLGMKLTGWKQPHETLVLRDQQDKPYVPLQRPT